MASLIPVDSDMEQVFQRHLITDQHPRSKKVCVLVPERERESKCKTVLVRGHGPDIVSNTEWQRRAAALAEGKKNAGTREAQRMEKVCWTNRLS